MKSSLPLFFSILTFIFFTSCANYINSLHRSFDRDEKGISQKSRPYQIPRRNYRQGTSALTPSSKYPQNKLRSFNNLDANTKNPSPSQRNYVPQRLKARDFQDREASGSLWADQGSGASLFTYQNDKRKGDLVIINVLEGLRNQISSELKRVFAESAPPKSKDSNSPDKKEDAANSANAATSNPQDNEVDVKVYDKISGTVIEEVNKDYILLRGLKDVIFKREKRAIEIRALVSRKDIMENDYVNSDKLLESRVVVLKKDLDEN